MNVKKTETMVCCKKGGAKVVVRERNGELNQVESFRYLGSVICASGGCEKDAQARVKWKEVSAVMNDRIPMRLKVKVYRTVTIYGSVLDAEG